jgi:hypothetical protein
MNNKMLKLNSNKQNKRILESKDWVYHYKGNDIIRKYAKRHRIPQAEALTDLRKLGHPVSYDIAKLKKNKNLHDYLFELEFESESDADFYYIAGYTEGGAPYGITWEEANENGLLDEVDLDSDDDELPF